MAPAVDRAAALVVALDRFSDAHNRRDWAALEELLVDDYVFIDHRPMSLGSGETRDEYIGLLKGAIELVPDRRTSVLTPVGQAPGYVVHMTANGTDEFGGGIDWDFFAVFDMRGDKLCRLEVFSVDDLDAALKRADELRSS